MMVVSNVCCNSISSGENSSISSSSDIAITFIIDNLYMSSSSGSGESKLDISKLLLLLDEVVANITCIVAYRH